MSSNRDVLDLLHSLDPVDPQTVPDGRSPEALAVADRIIGRRHRSTPAIVTAALVMVGAVIVATPAFGIRETISDLFGRENVTFEQTPPAATVTKRRFEDMSSGAPAGMDPQVVAGETRLAATFKIGGVNRRLWVAPTASGGYCYLWEHLGGGCNNSPRQPHEIHIDGSFRLRPGASIPTMEKLAGIVYDPHATNLELTFENERTVPLRFVYVSAPINAGFFAYNPTTAEQRPGHRPLKLTLLDATGQAVAENAINWKAQDRTAAELRRQAPRSGSPTQAPDAALEAQRRLLIDIRTETGHRLNLWVAPAQGGGECYWTNLRAHFCSPQRPRRVPRLKPVQYQPFPQIITGSRPVFLWGTVPNGTDELLLRFEDGVTRTIRPREGWILTEIPEARYRRGHRLTEMIARDRSGNTIATNPVTTKSDAMYPRRAKT